MLNQSITPGKSMKIQTKVRALLLSLVPIIGTACLIPTNSAQALPYGPDTCKSGYVWREAIVGDNVCVTPNTRSKTAYENSQAGYRVNPNGAYGSNTCIQGYVWREAFANDLVCVTPASRAQAQYDNARAQERKVSN